MRHGAVLAEPYQSEVIPVRDSGGLLSSQMLRISHCLENRLTDGGEIGSLTSRPRSTPQTKHFLVLVSVSG
jgi:hypothetical protein